MIKVSIIVPVYNIEKYIEDCLNSLVNQTIQDIEILVVNDGSTDNSQDIIEKYAQKYDNIKSYIKENGGLSDTRNFGLSKATGEYIVFIDGDDWIEKNALELLYNSAKENDSDIVICDFENVYENGNREIKQQIDTTIEDIQKAYMIAMPSSCNKLFKKDFLNSIGFKFYTGIFYEDLAVYPIVASKAKKISYVNEPLYKYRIRSGSIMNQQKNTKKLLDIFTVFDYIEKGINSIENKENFEQEIEYIYIKHLLHAASLRFINYKEDKNLDKISNIMKSKYPKWYKNNYYNKENIKYKIVCRLLYKKHYNLVRKLLKKGGKNG